MAVRKGKKAGPDPGRRKRTQQKRPRSELSKKEAEKLVGKEMASWLVAQLEKPEVRYDEEAEVWGGGSTLEIRRAESGARLCLAGRPLEQGEAIEMLQPSGRWMRGKFRWSGVEGDRAYFTDFADGLFQDFVSSIKPDTILRRPEDADPDAGPARPSGRGRD